MFFNICDRNDILLSRSFVVLYVCFQKSRLHHFKINLWSVTRKLYVESEKGNHSSIICKFD